MRRGQGKSTQSLIDALNESYPTNSSVLEGHVDSKNVTSAIPPTKIGNLESLK